MALPGLAGTYEPAGSYAYTQGAPGFGGGVSLQRQFLADPYKQQQLDIERQGQQFNQNLAGQKFALGADLYHQLMPMLGNFNLGGQRVGGSSAPQPALNTNPIFSPQQQQQQINAAFASNDARTSTLMKQLMESSAARGFGANSPAIQAQMTQLGIANLGQNALAQREIPLNVAQANADQAYRVNQLQQQQWAQGEDVDIRRRQQQLQLFGNLFGLLGGVV